MNANGFSPICCKKRLWETVRVITCELYGLTRTFPENPHHRGIRSVTVDQFLLDFSPGLCHHDFSHAGRNYRPELYEQEVYSVALGSESIVGTVRLGSRSLQSRPIIRPDQ